MVSARRRLRSVPWLLAGMLLVPGGWVLLAQITPDAPILDFRYPFFGEDGYKRWELRGTSGLYLDDKNQAVVEDLELVVYTGREDLREESRISSPKALIHLDESRAEGKSSLYMSGPGYSIQGSDWTWDGPTRTITVRKDVIVTFAGDLDILD